MEATEKTGAVELTIMLPAYNEAATLRDLLPDHQRRRRRAHP